MVPLLTKDTEDRGVCWMNLQAEGQLELQSELSADLPLALVPTQSRQFYEWLSKWALVAVNPISEERTLSLCFGLVLPRRYGEACSGSAERSWQVE